MRIDDHHQEIIHCQKCIRLVRWREEIAYQKRKAYQSWEYWGKPVPGFGDLSGRVIVVGLAPGAHGSNRTGRMFTGDASGDFLFPALNRAGFASKGISEHRNDGLVLNDMFITAVCRCVPPDNKPTSEEILNCRNYLQTEIRMMENLKVIVTLGAIAHYEIKHYLWVEKGILNLHPFSHLGMTRINELGISVISSYHPSRQNTQTGRLTEEMFDGVWKKVQENLNKSDVV